MQTPKEEPRPPPSSQSIPAFYFPRGRPQDATRVDAAITRIEHVFAQFPQERATAADMGQVAKVRVAGPRAALVPVCTLLPQPQPHRQPGPTSGSLVPHPPLVKGWPRGACRGASPG